MDKIIENNQVTVMGEIASEFEFSHEVFGEGFYMLELLVKRLSDSFDRIPVMISGAPHRCDAGLSGGIYPDLRPVPVL